MSRRIPSTRRRTPRGECSTCRWGSRGARLRPAPRCSRAWSCAAKSRGSRISFTARPPSRPRAERHSMRKFGRRGSSSSSRGLTLVELLVTLVILSILAAVALPYAEVAVRRAKELELRRALRAVRTAIDACYAAWKGGKISKTATAASEDGYPKTLQVLLEGADSSDAKGS